MPSAHHQELRMVTRSTLPLILGLLQLYKVHSTSAPSLCQKLASSAVFGFVGSVISSTVGAALQPQHPLRLSQLVCIAW